MSAQPPSDHSNSADEPLVTLTMTREAADKFLAALGYAAALAEGMAEANWAPQTRAKIEEHASWVRWGESRLHAVVASDEEERR